MKKIILPGLATAVALAVWNIQRIEMADLVAQVEALREQNREADALRREQERLRRLQPDPAALAAAQHDANQALRLKRELASRNATQPSAPERSFTNNWASARTWQNRGRANPAAVVETALWAAAGGDVVVLQDVLEFDAAARAPADALFARLPESARTHYATPEHLIAAFTAKSIPLGDAQLVWQQQSGPDEASVCVFLRDRRAAPEAAAVATSPKETGSAPPSLPESAASRSAYLALRRSADGWRLVVPASAVETIAKEIGGSR